MLDVPPPNDPKRYTFEKHVSKSIGGKGYADAWKRGHFGWEYKRPGGDLAAAYQQLLEYREDLENPPLLVVCDFRRFEVHTNFTATKKRVIKLTLDDLREAPSEPIRILRATLSQPRALRPTETREELTEAAASDFADLAGKLQARGHDPLAVAHFLNKLLFCLFAEDVRILPEGLLLRMTSRDIPIPLATQHTRLKTDTQTTGVS